MGQPYRPQRQPIPPRQGSKNRSFKQQFALVVGAATAMAVWYLTPVSDYVAEIMLLSIPIQADLDLQRESLRNFPYRTVRNSEWSPEIDQLGRTLVQNLKQVSNGKDYNEYRWDFGIIRADMVNAFCLPGGVIRVTDTLLQTLQPTTGELAALLGHEIGHVVSRHAQKRLLTQQLTSYLLSALVYEDGDEYKESFGEALGELITKSASWLGQQHFSRKDEYQADAVAWDLLAKGRGNPKSLESLLSKLQRLESGGPHSDNLIAAWSRTHPATTSRVEAARNKWNELSEKEQRMLVANPI